MNSEDYKENKKIADLALTEYRLYISVCRRLGGIIADVEHLCDRNLNVYELRRIKEYTDEESQRLHNIYVDVVRKNIESD